MEPTQGDWRSTLSTVGEKPLRKQGGTTHIITISLYDRVTVHPQVGETMNRGA
jgi:hypothetical protein